MPAVHDLRGSFVEPAIVDNALPRRDRDHQVDLDWLRRRQLMRQNADKGLEPHCAQNNLVRHLCHAASIARRISRAKVIAVATLSAAARTIALPTTTPSASFATAVAWSGRETPNPTQLGSEVAARRRSIDCGRSLARESCTPVTPRRLI